LAIQSFDGRRDCHAIIINAVTGGELRRDAPCRSGLSQGAGTSGVQVGFAMAKTTTSAQYCPMNVTEDVEELKMGMEEKSRGSVEKGAEVYSVSTI